MITDGRQDPEATLHEQVMSARASASRRSRGDAESGCEDADPVRVLIVDHHPIVRRGLHEIIADADDLVVGGEASKAFDALEHIRRTDCRCSVMVIELALPGGGLELLRQVAHERPDLRSVVLSIYPEEQYGLRAFQAGAAGYLSKECAPADLLAAIRKVSAGGRWVSAGLAEQLAIAVGGPTGQAPNESLSNRELQVLRLLGGGRTVKQAAQDLHLSEKTVSTYRARLLQKLGLGTTAQLIRHAIENGLVD